MRRRSSRAGSRNPTEFLVLTESSLKKEGEAETEHEDQDKAVVGGSFYIGMVNV
jgi:hypothetical protein